MEFFEHGRDRGNINHDGDGVGVPGGGRHRSVATLALNRVVIATRALAGEPGLKQDWDEVGWRCPKAQSRGKAKLERL
jgi:hypothetical protein